MASGAHNRHICRDGNGYGCWGGNGGTDDQLRTRGGCEGPASAQRTELLDLFGDTLADSPAAGAVGHGLNKCWAPHLLLLCPLLHLSGLGSGMVEDGRGWITDGGWRMAMAWMMVVVGDRWDS